MQYGPLHIERELRRLGVDPDALGGLASAEPLTHEVILTWLRWLPTGLGHDEFIRRLELPADQGGPELALRDPALVPADPGHQDAEIDERLAFYRELDRVVWPALRARYPGGSYGIDTPHGRAAALANLARLPDGASADEVMAALNAPPANPGHESGHSAS